jgi:N6-L-threonylcarbamoyladenine synthase
MIVLGIESSCDETAAALVRDDGFVLSDVVASQIALHAPFGGVVPELAARAHLEAVGAVVAEAARVLPNGLRDVDVISVTQGPGLVGALLVGVQVGKTIAWSLDKPLVGVSHLDGHLLSPFLRRADEDVVPELPYIALLVSGGHSALYRVDAPDAISLLGQTRDDAAGEAFDKVAKLLGLGYPGGPLVDRLAKRGDAKAVALPRPMLGRDALEFSFAGLKTAVARHVEKYGMPQTDDARADICASFQAVVAEALVTTSLRACVQENVRRLVITGGVAANAGLRALAQARCAESEVALFIPPFASCTDNAAMIALAGAYRYAKSGADSLDLTVYSRDARRRRGRFDADGKLVSKR